MNQSFHDFLQTLGVIQAGDWPIPILGIIMLTIFLGIAIGIYYLLIHLIKNYSNRLGISPDLFNGLKFLIRFVIIIVFIGLTTTFLEMSNEYAIILTGVLTTAIAFGSMKAINNFISGLWITLTRPFTVGDYVEIRGVEGIVDEITLNFTKIKHKDFTTTQIPNIECLGSGITNFTISIDELNKEVTLLKSSLKDLDLNLSKKENNEQRSILNKVKNELQEKEKILGDITKLMNGISDKKPSRLHPRRISRKSKKRSKEESDEEAEDNTEEQAETLLEKVTEKSSNGAPQNNNEENVCVEPARSQYFERKKIIRYTFTIELERNEIRKNAEILDKVCKDWAIEFEFTPEWQMVGVTSMIEYRIIILTPDPEDIINYFDDFVKDIYVKLRSNNP